MKAMFVNGSPRKNWNTHRMLESAMKGASDSGAECEMIHLYDYSYKGCVSCFACKVKNSRTHGLCAYRDELRPVLERALTCDVIVMGTPIYYSLPTGMMRSFMERLLFPAMSYSHDKDGNPIRAFNGTIYTATILTMNCTEELAANFGYPAVIEANAFGLRYVMGYTETLCAYNTVQFTDYSRYDANNFDGDERMRYRDEHFPEDLRKAYDLGKRLVEMAKG